MAVCHELVKSVVAKQLRDVLPFHSNDALELYKRITGNPVAITTSYYSSSSKYGIGREAAENPCVAYCPEEICRFQCDIIGYQIFEPMSDVQFARSQWQCGQIDIAERTKASSNRVQHAKQVEPADGRS
jgi:hypothetical protein